MDRSDFLYHPYYCEENALLLAGASRLAETRRWVVFVTNRNRTCAYWRQRSRPDGGPVVWDYHVFVVARISARLVALDLDSTLAFPVDLDAYLHGSFPDEADWKEMFRPRFRVVNGDQALETFASDRRHMLRSDGSWQSPPPPWPILQGAGAPHNLDRWIAFDDPKLEPMHSLADLRLAFATELPSR